MTRAMHRVLIVEDQPLLRSVLETTLDAAGYRTSSCDTVARAMTETRAGRPDVLLLDLGLPDGDGVDVVRSIRRWSTVPIIVVSARHQEAQKVAALDAGADDYVTKPFGSEELLARVRAALRRAPGDGTHAPRLVFGNSRVDLAQRLASGPDGSALHLTPLEYRLLDALTRRAGLIVPHRQLLREVWGPDRSDDPRVLRVCMKGLRDKLEPDAARPRFLLTEVGVGYRLAESAIVRPGAET